MSQKRRSYAALNHDNPTALRFVFVNRFYWPDEQATAQLLADLAESLAAAGHAVTVVASHPGQSCPRVEIRLGVAVFRVRSTRWSRSGLAGKLIDFVSFYLGALWSLARTARRGDIVVAMTDPPLIGIGAWLVARLRGARVVHWVQDIYPEIAITLTGHRWLGLAKPFRNLAWRASNRCVTLGTDMAATVVAKGVPPDRVSVIPNWAPTGLAPATDAAVLALRESWGLSDKFVLLYSGNLGRVHDLEPLLDLAEQLGPVPRITLVFVGGGPQHASLVAAARNRGLANVRFFPAQPRASLSVALALGDLHIVTLRPGCAAAVFPSKLYGIAAVGRPVLFVGPRQSEIARTIREHGFGVCFQRDETAAVAAAVVALSTAPDQRAKLALAAERFSRSSGDARSAARLWAALAVQVGST